MSPWRKKAEIGRVKTFSSPIYQHENHKITESPGLADNEPATFLIVKYVLPY